MADAALEMRTMVDPFLEHLIDQAVVRFYRNLFYHTIKDAVSCAHGKALECKRTTAARKDVYNWIRMKRFRDMCTGLQHDYFTVESTIRGIIAGGEELEKAEQLLKQYDQEAVFYAKRSTGRPKRKDPIEEGPEGS